MLHSIIVLQMTLSNPYTSLWAGGMKCRMLAGVRAWRCHCPFMWGKHLFPFPFHQIFVLSHPGNEDSCYGKIERKKKKSQRSRHCKHRHSSSSDNYRASPERLQFSRRPYKQRGRGKERACKACACGNFNQARRPWRWLTKGRGKKTKKKKTPSLSRRHVSFQSPWHD